MQVEEAPLPRGSQISIELMSMLRGLLALTGFKDIELCLSRFPLRGGLLLAELNDGEPEPEPEDGDTEDDKGGESVGKGKA